MAPRGAAEGLALAGGLLAGVALVYFGHGLREGACVHMGGGPCEMPYTAQDLVPLGATLLVAAVASAAIWADPKRGALVAAALAVLEVAFILFSGISGYVIWLGAAVYGAPAPLGLALAAWAARVEGRG